MTAVLRASLFTHDSLMGLHWHGFADPLFDSHAHLLESALEEVVSSFDAHQLLRIGERTDQRFQCARRSELIARSADEEFGLSGSSQEFEIVSTGFDCDRGQAERDERVDPVIGIGGTQSNGGAKRESGENNGERKLAFEPVQRGADVFHFADAIGVLAFAQAGAAEVEAQDGKSEAVESLHGVEDNLVVKRSTVKWMGMADDGSMRRISRSGIEQSFQPSDRAGKKKRPDAGGFGRHRIRVQQVGGDRGVGRQSTRR